MHLVISQLFQLQSLSLGCIPNYDMEPILIQNIKCTKLARGMEYLKSIEYKVFNFPSRHINIDSTFNVVTLIQQRWFNRRWLQCQQEFELHLLLMHLVTSQLFQLQSKCTNVMRPFSLKTIQGSHALWNSWSISKCFQNIFFYRLQCTSLHNSCSCKCFLLVQRNKWWNSNWI